jgi:hypothetical protein
MDLNACGFEYRDRTTEKIASEKRQQLPSDFGREKLGLHADALASIPFIVSSCGIGTVIVLGYPNGVAPEESQDSLFEGTDYTRSVDGNHVIIQGFLCEFWPDIGGFVVCRSIPFFSSTPPYHWSAHLPVSARLVPFTRGASSLHPCSSGLETQVEFANICPP